MEPSFRSPLFDRLSHAVTSPGYNEVNTFMEQQQRRIQELERINVDLERRLEQQARERMKIERESAENKRMWQAQHAEIGKERDEWKSRYEKELLHMHKLRENNRRLERELHGILQKKYDFMQASKQQAGKGGQPGQGGEGGAGAGGGSNRPPERSMVRAATIGGSGGAGGGAGGGLRGEPVSLNPKDLTPETVREKRVIQSLSDFFGF